MASFNHVVRRDMNWTRSKAWSHYLLVALFLVLGPFMVLVARESIVFTLLQLIASLSLLLLIFLWCLSDSLEGDYPMGKWVALAILLVPYIGVPIYFLRGRGLSRGLQMLGKAILFSLFLAALTVGTAGITTYFTGLSLPA